MNTSFKFLHLNLMNLFKQIKAFLLLSVLLFALGHNAFPHVHHQHQHSTDTEHEVHHNSHDHNHQHESHQHETQQHEDSSQDWQDLNFLQVLLDGHSSTNHTHQYTPLLLEPLKSKKQLDQKLIQNFGQVEIVVPHREADLKQGFNALIRPYESVNLSINPLRGPPSKV
ncbi:hypothetical protein MATR_06580 [Marivirga tractuosa]|uniref:DUF2796 domain-containing protein n=2 Tax=Marivirga TaxID=869806 RepID=E4TRI8_MARTH|nr:hypothetical protein Ftrac_1721 [Marivirga tractuosa DSM 4126]BDD13833.1 hypothetical protein MATR_06580 [Marivirga tractuosa]